LVGYFREKDAGLQRGIDDSAARYSALAEYYGAHEIRERSQTP
jgi:hypothetical protein